MSEPGQRLTKDRPRVSGIPGWLCQPRELSVGLAVAAAALGGAYWQAERTAAFEADSKTGETLRLVCPLH